MTNQPENVAFRTRARTIDHLGREQIADVPTAVSELWKNAYDAYARSVALHLYAGERPAAAIFDDGFGMSREDFLGRWLVVGTESKASDEAVAAELRGGLKERPKQGQKGIGRLSVAAIGAAVLVVTKRKGFPFVACLLDWRLFENPFLLLEDVTVPVVEFDSTSELAALAPQLRDALLANVEGPITDAEKRTRLRQAWASFDRLERGRDGVAQTTAARIRALAKAGLPSLAPLEDWGVWTGERPTGTALVLADVNPFLTAWVTGPQGQRKDDVDVVVKSLQRTLTGFSDPYSADDLSLDYRVVVHKTGEPEPVIARDPEHGIEFLRSLDHFVDGGFDEQGVFTATIKAYGRDQGKVEYIPAQPPPTAMRDRPGAFAVTIGAFEPELKSSTLSDDVHARVAGYAELHSGLNVYRDGLRVMPYGRPENDFFKIEERRTSNAGREFWSSRRLFGRLAITRAGNPNLRDKAGREGLIDNTASRAMQTLMIDVLRRLARDFFGSNSEIRKELLPAIEAENSDAARKAKDVRRRTLNAFRSAVRERAPKLEQARQDLDEVRRRLDAAIVEGDPADIWALGEPIEALVTTRTDLRLPPKPKSLGAFESQYRTYRDGFAAYVAELEEMRAAWRDESERVNAEPDAEVARTYFGRGQQAVVHMLNRWGRDIGAVLTAEQKRVAEQVENDRKEFYKHAAPLLTDLEKGEITLSQALGQMDSLREQLTERFASVYDPYLRSVHQLAEGMDLDSALTYSDANTQTLETQLQRVQALAQVGISVEILAHELHALNRRLAGALTAFPDETKSLPEFRVADEARRELVERLRFLSQMQINEGDAKREVSGGEIFEYVAQFFDRIFVERNVGFTATAAFRAARFSEFPSRIFPVFINLVNNALYWVADAPRREILFDVQDGALVVADTGPGVDPDDVANLFELFFTRRIRGRGVGLYLCRQTLAAGGHTITYVTDAAEKVLPGANFKIRIRDGLGE